MRKAIKIPLLDNSFFYGMLIQSYIGPPDKDYLGEDSRSIFYNEGIIWKGRLNIESEEPMYKFMKSANIENIKIDGDKIRFF